MFSPKRLGLVFTVMLFCRITLAGNLLYSPEQPVSGDTIVLSVDEFFADGTQVVWKYRRSDEAQWQDIAGQEGFPSFVAQRPGAVFIRCEITTAGRAKKFLQRVIEVRSAGDRVSGNLSFQATGTRQAEKRRALDERLESKYGVSQQVSAALHEYHVYDDDQQFLTHAGEVAEMYRRGAEYYENVGKPEGPADIPAALKILQNDIDKFKAGLDPGSFAKQAWSKFFIAEGNLSVKNWRQHKGDLAKPQAHAAYYREVAQGIDVERQQGQAFIENYKTYQSYMNRYAPEQGRIGRESDGCLRILFGH